MLLLELASDGVLVAEDKVNLWRAPSTRVLSISSNPNTRLGARARQVRTKHDGPGSLVVELLAAGLETILKELDVATTAVAALLVLDLVLHDQGLVGELDGVLERRRDGVVCRLGLRDEALVTLDKDGLGILDLPLADVRERLAADGGLLGRL